MKVLLVNPPRYNGIPVIREERCEITERHSVLPPYSLLQIASILRQDGHNVSLIDANGDDVSLGDVKHELSRRVFDVLLFRFTPTTFDWDMKVADHAKTENERVWTVGICFTLTSLPRQVLNEAPSLDIYVTGEYEAVTPLLVQSLDDGVDLTEVGGIAYRENGTIRANTESPTIDSYDSLPLPAYDLLDGLDPYFINTRAGRPFTILYSSKGCPFDCVFCTVAGTRYRRRSAESVLAELRYLKENYGIRTVSFFDETFTLDKKRVVDLAAGITRESLDVIWYCNTRVNLVDVELLRIMKEAGCRGISYGIESGSDMILRRASKGITVEQGKNAIRWAKKLGIKTYCSFIFGLPGENWRTVQDTIDFVGETLPTSAQFNVCVPYPGTALWDSLQKNETSNRIDWRRLTQHEAQMGSEELSASDLEKARMMAYRSLYFNPIWWLGNIWHIIRNPQDLNIASKYALKILDNFLVHRMRHAH